MELPKYRCYKLNRFFLLLLGLWPYNNSFFKRIQTIFCLTILISTTFVQFLKLFTMEYDLEILLTGLSTAIPFLIYLLKYNTCHIQSERIRKIMEKIQNNWSMFKKGREIEIIKKYDDIGRRYIYGFVVLAYPGTFSFVLVQLMPNFLDVVAPLNESRLRILPFITEYFLDQQKYFYLIFFHMNTAILLGVLIFTATESLMFTYIHHICGLFKIVSYRIEHAFDGKMLSTSNSEHVIRIEIIDAVKMHQTAIKFSNYLVSTFSISYFILTILGIASLSINLFRLFQFVTMPGERLNLLLIFMFVCSHFGYMFVGNYLGQKMIDYSSGVFEKIYGTQWYATSVQTQKLLMFVMQRSMKSCNFTLGVICPMSLENFTSLTSMSLSYFTMIYSVQQ